MRPHTRFVHFPKHRHNYVEIIYMCRGTTTHIIDGSRVVLEEGDLLFLNQHAEQEILPAGETDIAVNFIILPEFFDTAFWMMREKNALREFLMGTLGGNYGLSSYLYFHVSNILPVQNLVNTGLDYFLRYGKQTELQSDHYGIIASSSSELIWIKWKSEAEISRQN